MNRRVNLALLILISACLHEFVWQAFSIKYQGDVRAITQWFLWASCGYTIHKLANHLFVTAAMVAVTIMTLTTAGCAFWWVLTEFVKLPGQEQCSKEWGVPMLLISAFAALVVFFRWPNVKRS